MHGEEGPRAKTPTASRTMVSLEAHMSWALLVFLSFSPFLRWRTSRVSETAERRREKVGKENHADH